jgi:hypothetical protein
LTGIGRGSAHHSAESRVSLVANHIENKIHQPISVKF